MILKKNPKTGYYTELPGNLTLIVHAPELCEGRGCAIHDRPSDHLLAGMPLNWREDRGILERICSHGIGHPDEDSARYLESIGHGVQNVHGCCHLGCCSGPREGFDD